MALLAVNMAKVAHDKEVTVRARHDSSVAASQAQRALAQLLQAAPPGVVEGVMAPEVVGDDDEAIGAAAGGPVIMAPPDEAVGAAAGGRARSASRTPPGSPPRGDHRRYG